MSSLLRADAVSPSPRRQGPFRRLRRALRARDLGTRAGSAAGRNRPVSAPARISSRILPGAEDWVGRPTALSPAPTLSKRWGAQVWLKREDLAHTGAHKINNAIGQTLAGKAPGSEAHHRGNRRRPARGGKRGSRRTARNTLRGVHGLGRCRAAGPQCGSHEIVGDHRGAGDERR